VEHDSNEDIFTAACRRELNEELVLPDGQLPLSPLGILNDDSTEVGSVHLGLVYRLDAEALSVAVRETEAMEGGFQSLSSLQSLITNDQDPFESWSSLLIRSDALSAAVSTLY
jgi:predicted NUDIX family phosphoesterase